MKILFVASECAPFVKTGGLADVVSALPKALMAQGHDVRILLPGYPSVLEATGAGKAIPKVSDLRLCEADGQTLFVLNQPKAFERPSNPYLDETGRDWPDNWQRFGALCQAGADIALGRAGSWKPNLVHIHDWQAGLIPAYLKFAGGPPSVATIHNIAFQGVVDASHGTELGLPADAFTPDGYEYYGGIGYLKAALVYADAITTVSPTYAREIMTPEFGFGLQGLLRFRREVVSGILNGIDMHVWDPATDPLIEAPYSIGRMKGKARNKQALCDRFALDPDATGPLFCVISRLSDQKGIDLLVAALPQILAGGGQLAVLGSGDASLENMLQNAAADHPGQVGVILGYDEPLSHLMQAGSDAIIIPSRFEPCGLTQLYGLRYGTLPIVARTGGLADTVIDLNEAALLAGTGNGFQFSPVTPEALGDAILRATAMFADRESWKAARRRAMRQPVGWETSAAAYARLYESVLAAHD